MAQFNPYEQYNNVSFSTADPGSLVVTTYNAIIRALKEASRGMIEGDYTARTKSFDLAFELISELRKSINPEAGTGEFAKKLDALYDFFTRELITANANSNPEKLIPVIEILVDLRDAWNQARKQVATA
ncbi:MAG: flagellar export chaperone FliS [Candidatus Electryonea clarkiae]|nr:flagellar export chaperone FliS [Candidatus Electryonea clarkiae]MDP8286121.1 flagellar export chaperone FliS [Candidatus Electryonea clarkiae]